MQYGNVIFFNIRSDRSPTGHPHKYTKRGEYLYTEKIFRFTADTQSTSLQQLQEDLKGPHSLVDNEIVYDEVNVTRCLPLPALKGKNKPNNLYTVQWEANCRRKDQEQQRKYPMIVETVKKHKGKVNV